MPIVFLIAGLLGGLAFFLLGIKMMSDGLQKSAGKQMRNTLGRLTRNRLSAFLVGILITVMVQSSSATTVMLVSFVNSRLMLFARTVAIILGASVGATITVQIIAFRLTDYALLIIGVSYLFHALLKNPRYRDISYAVMGFGLLFFGMHIMSQAMEPLKSMKSFTGLLLILENPVLAILLGTLMTALIQSSSAFIGILIVLASQHLITLEASVPLIIGANLGTCITAIIACTGLSRESKQVALAHTLFKATGALIVVWFIPQIVNLVENVSLHTSPDHASYNYSPATIARQIANVHTVYNLAIALLFLPFSRLYGNFITRLIPARDEIADRLKTWYLDASLIKTPPLALAVARQEILRMIQTSHRMAEDIIIPFIEKKPAVIMKIRDKETEINFLRDKINAYLIKITQQDIEPNLVEDTFTMMYAVNEFEQIGDIIASTLCDKAQWWCNTDFSFSEKGKEEIMNFHLMTLKLLYAAYGVLSEINRDKAKKMKSKYQDFRNMYVDLEKHHYQRLKEEIEESVDSSKTHLEVITSLKSIGSHATNIARILLKNKVL
ncbi:MAG: Na/Pi cotransporter family protein [Bacteroidales bacterium]|nr:Na/Pi cotransporter family protein [Bacteroidales bacterium]MBN2762711.1 Na/Pi cotransporter family protein [Bacteroidales bacterium]